MRRIRLMAGALVALCWAACVAGGAPASAVAGGETIAGAPTLGPGRTLHGQLHDSAFPGGYAAAYWKAPLLEGDRLSIAVKMANGDTPPCLMLFLPGTTDANLGPTAGVLDAAKSKVDGALVTQRFAKAAATGTYVLTATSLDQYLSGSYPCLNAPAGSPFTLKVKVVHRGSASAPTPRRGSGRHAHRAGAGSSGSSTATQTVRPGQSLWLIAQGLVADPGDVGRVAFKVNSLWRLNAARIGTGDRDLIFPGQQLRLR
jgi:hypothetical protein